MEKSATPVRRRAALLTATILIAGGLVSACGADLNATCSDWHGFSASDKTSVEQALLSKYNLKDSGFKELAADGAISLYCKSAAASSKIGDMGQDIVGRL